jgi:hypothetical protein
VKTTNNCIGTPKNTSNKEINMAKANEIIKSLGARLTKNHKFPLIQEL